MNRTSSETSTQVNRLFSLRTALLTLTVAGGITLLLTPVMNSVDRPLSREDPFLDGVLGFTVRLDEFLGIGTGSSLEVTPECLAHPEVARFLNAIERRTRPLLGNPALTYYSSMVVPQYFAEGWPFETRAVCARLIIDESGPGASACGHIILADENGEPPERPAGRRANWIFYSCVSIPLAWLLVTYFPLAAFRRNTPPPAAQTECES